MDQQSEMLYYFYCMSNSRFTKIYKNYGADHLILPMFFLKKRKRTGTSSLPNFLHSFREKYFSRYILLTDQI